MQAFLVSRRMVHRVAGAVVLAAAFTTPAAALEAPSDKPILTVVGKIEITNNENKAQFDRAMLESLGVVKFETTTPWYKGPVTFEGVPLEKVLSPPSARMATASSQLL